MKKRHSEIFCKTNPTISAKGTVFWLSLIEWSPSSYKWSYPHLHPHFPPLQLFRLDCTTSGSISSLGVKEKELNLDWRRWEGGRETCILLLIHATSPPSQESASQSSLLFHKLPPSVFLRRPRRFSRGSSDCSPFSLILPQLSPFTLPFSQIHV